jgi:hypothetical protein
VPQASFNWFWSRFPASFRSAPLNAARMWNTSVLQPAGSGTEISIK